MKGLENVIIPTFTWFSFHLKENVVTSIWKCGFNFFFSITLFSNMISFINILHLSFYITLFSISFDPSIFHKNVQQGEG
jgi:hypothetical protein